jgi:hypothetical protein
LQGYHWRKRRRSCNGFGETDRPASPVNTCNRDVLIISNGRMIPRSERNMKPAIDGE